MNEMEMTVTFKADEQDLIQAGKRHQNQLATKEALAEEINTAYEAYNALLGDVTSLGLRIENERIALGTLLLTAKKVVGHGNFEDWLACACPAVSKTTAERYMKYSKKRNGELLTSVDEIGEYNRFLKYVGAVEDEEGRGHGAQTLHVWNAFTEIGKMISKTRETFTLAFEKRPRDEWADDEKEQLRELAQPLIELIENL